MQEIRKQLNKIYKPLCKEMEKWQKWFEGKGWKTKLSFSNHHFIEQEGKLFEEFFPLPVLDVFSKPKFDFVLDLDSASLEFTFTKSQLLKFNFEKLKNINWQVYGAVNNCTTNYYNNNLEELRKNIKNSSEPKLHLGIELGLNNLEKQLAKIMEIINAYSKPDQK